MMAFIVTASWLLIGALYGLHLSRRYAQTKRDLVLIPTVSAVAWPFLVMVERG
jgi:hypothetical protein